jgi:hypothetical protein
MWAFAGRSPMPVVATDERRPPGLVAEARPSGRSGSSEFSSRSPPERHTPPRRYEWASSGSSYQRIRSPTLARSFHRRDFGARSMASTIASMLGPTCAMRSNPSI